MKKETNNESVMKKEIQYCESDEADEEIMSINAMAKRNVMCNGR